MRMEFKFLYNNINGFFSKELLLKNYIEKESVMCCLLVETKTKDPKVIRHRDWSILQKHGNTLNGNARGGAAVLCAPSLNLRKENPPSLNNALNDCLHFSIPYNNDHIHIFLLYSHATSTIEPTVLHKISQYENVILIGDFNFNQTKSRLMKTFLNNSDFIHHKTNPTFIMSNNPDSTPDRLYSTANLKDVIKDIKLVSDIGSDHLGIQFSLKMHLVVTPSPHCNFKYNLNKTNLKLVNEQVTNYVKNLKNDNITTKDIDKFQNLVTDTIKDNSPKLIHTFFKHKLPNYIIVLIKKKRKLFREYKQFDNQALKVEINKLNKSIHVMVSQFKLSNWLDVCQEIQNDQGKSFWNKIKKVTNYKKNVNTMPSLYNNNNWYITDQEKADVLANNYQEAYTPQNNLLFDDLNYRRVNNWLNDFITDTSNNNYELITDEEYYQVLGCGKNTSPGHDLLNRKILRNLSIHIHEYIIKMYNACLKMQHFPDIWKRGTIITILKPNEDKTIPRSYRPITLLPILGKNFETIIKNRLWNKLETKIPHFQFGFKPGNSTQHPLFVLINNLQCSHLENKFSGALFLDISKAFDSIWHAGLLFKLNYLGTPHYLTKIILSFLNQRTLQVKINNTLSYSFIPQQGVPQGSPLSPLLYNFFSYDIFKLTNLNAYILQFADDTCLIAHNKNRNKMLEQLQALTNEVTSWFLKWRLLPNPKKTQLLLPYQNIAKRPQSITMLNTTIDPSHVAKYLGIYLDSKITLVKHAQTIKKEIIKRAKYFKILRYKDSGVSTNTAVYIYKSTCRPLLDYYRIVSACGSKKMQKAIEVSETSALRAITKIRHSSNPLHNPSNNSLYSRCKIEKITERFYDLRAKFASNTENLSKIKELCITRANTTSKFKLPPSTLYEFYNKLNIQP